MAWSPPVTDEAVNTWSPPKKDKEIGWTPPDAPHFGTLGEPQPLTFDEAKSMLSWTPPQADPVQGPREATDIERRSEAGLQGLPTEVATAILMGAGTDPLSAAAGRGIVAGAKMFGEGVANLAGKVLTPEAEMLLAKGQPIIEKMAASGEPAAVLSEPAGGFASIVRAPGVKELGPSGIASYIPGKVAQVAETAAAAEAAQTVDPLLSQRVGAAMKGVGPATEEGSSGLLGGSKATISPLETPSGKVSLPGIRPEKFASDAERAMAEEVISRMPDDRVAQAGGKPQSWAVTAAKAVRTGWTKDTILNLGLNQAYTPEQTVRIGQVFANENERLYLLKVALEKAQSEAPDSMVTKALASTYAQQMGDVVRIGIIRTGALSTEGRALNAGKIALKGVDDITATMAKALSKAKPEVRELVIKQLMDIPPAELTPAKYTEILQKLDKWSVRKMIAEWSTTARLWSPLTHAVNVGTETANILWDIPVKAVAGILDKAGNPLLTKLYGEGRVRWFGEAAADVKGMIEGIKIGGYKAFQALLHPGDVSAMLEGRGGMSIAIKGRPGQNTWVDKLLDVVGKGARLSYAGLGIEDIFLKSIAEQGQIHAFVFRQVAKEGENLGAGVPWVGTPKFLEGVEHLLQHPGVTLLERAAHSADVMIFREESGIPIRLAHELLDHVPEMRLITPFVKIGPNIVRESLKKGPGTVLLPSTWASLKDRGAMLDMVSNAVLGTAAMIPLVYHAKAGGINLKAPTDRHARDKFFADGHLEDSFNVLGYDVPVSRVAPYGEFFTTSARFLKMVENKDMDSAGELLATFAFGQIKNYADKTFLQGLNELLQAVMNGGRYGTKFLRNLATSSTLPTPIGLAARVIDPTYRKVESFGEAFMAKTPGVSSDLFPETGLFGEDRQRAGSPLMRAISPVVPSKVQEEPVRKFLKDNLLKVDFPPDTMNERKLSFAEQNAISKTTGPLIKDFIIRNQQVLHGLVQEGKLKDAQEILNKEVSENRKPAMLLLTVPAELRALKLTDASMLPKKTLDALHDFITTEPAYIASKDDAFKRDLLQTIIDAQLRAR